MARLIESRHLHLDYISNPVNRATKTVKIGAIQHNRATKTVNNGAIQHNRAS
jgi:hypothetical protein